MIDALEACFGVCGLTPAQQQRFRNYHGINTVDDLSDLTPSENENLVKTYNEGLTAAQRAANRIGGIPERRMKAVLWCLSKKKILNTPFVHTEWTVPVMRTTMAEMDATIEMEKSDKKIKAQRPKEKFDRGLKYHNFKRLFESYIGQCESSYGHGMTMSYLLRNRTPPATFKDQAEREMYSVTLSGTQFEADNKFLFTEIQAMTMGTSVYPFLREWEEGKDGRNAWLTLVDQCEGADNSKLRITEANNIISLEKGPKWNPNNRNGGTFPEYVSQLKDGFYTYSKERQAHSQETQVERLVGGIKAPNNATMQIAIEKVKDDFKSDFDGAAQYLANKIVEVYGNEVNSSNKNSRNVWDTRDDGRGRGRGRGCTLCSARGGRGGKSPQTKFNGESGGKKQATSEKENP